jgi:hypothetical protein
MKLVNFASLDPEHQARGVKGLSGHSRGDEAIWNEFRDDWDRMAVLSETKLQDLKAEKRPTTPAIFDADGLPWRDVATDTEATVRVRTMQTFFRKVVLAAYNSTCCITGNPVAELLVASHILPWSRFPQHRLNPQNGLCLAAHFDRAFDRYLIAFDTEMRLVVSPLLRQYLPNPAIESEFLWREGQRLSCPDRFSPNLDFLAHHPAPDVPDGMSLPALAELPDILITNRRRHDQRFAFRLLDQARRHMRRFDHFRIYLSQRHNRIRE